MMPIRVRFAVAAIAVLVAALVVVLLLRGYGEEERPDGRISEGGAGFALRGSLASDEAAIDAAVSAWRDRPEKKADDDDEAANDTPDPLAGRRPESDDDVDVLWAGNVDRYTDVAILHSAEVVAALERRPDGEWHIEDEVRHERLDTPVCRSASATGSSRPDGQWRGVRVGRGLGPKEVADGLFRADGLDDEGFVLPEDRGGERLGLYVVDAGARLIEPRALEALEAAIADGQGRAVYQAAYAAEQPLTAEAERGTATRELMAPPMLEVLWTGRLEGRPHAAVIAQESAYRRSLALGFGEVPTDEEVERAETEEERDADKAGSELLGYGRAELGRGGRRGLFGGAYVELDRFPYLVVAGRDLASLHVLVGDREITRRGPVAVLDALAFGEPGKRPDTVIYGRTAGGEVVAPLTVP